MNSINSSALPLDPMSYEYVVTDAWFNVIMFVFLSYLLKIVGIDRTESSVDSL